MGIHMFLYCNILCKRCYTVGWSPIKGILLNIYTYCFIINSELEQVRGPNPRKIKSENRLLYKGYDCLFNGTSSIVHTTWRLMGVWLNDRRREDLEESGNRQFLRYYHRSSPKAVSKTTKHPTMTNLRTANRTGRIQNEILLTVFLLSSYQSSKFLNQKSVCIHCIILSTPSVSYCIWLA
jgi:hypothetical protein